jgi:hypothetical protein
VTAPPTSPNRLYELMPAMHRIADEETGGELKALLGLINQSADAVREDVRQLWDDYFIETSQRWVVPYIGDLIGNIPLIDPDVRDAAATAESLFRDLRGPDLAVVNPVRIRADVAKTIYYRRRKGTPTMLEQLARDVTGWDARVVEFFQLLDWNQHLEHLRLGCAGCPDLRSNERTTRIDGPWDEATHTVDVRAINEWDGWYGIRNIGFFLWRLRAAQRTTVVPRAVGGTTWRFTISPLGQDVPLFSGGDGRQTGAGRATELTVQDAIRPAAFFTDLAAVPAAPPPTESAAYYGPDGAARLVVTANGIVVPASDIRCYNLETWTALAQPNDAIVGIDVARGRLIRGSQRNGQTLRVTFCEGTVAEYGGGEYSRGKWLAAGPAVTQVSGGGAALTAAIAARIGPATVLSITDNLTYDLPAFITLAAGERLTIEAADERRPHLVPAAGELEIRTAGAGASLTLNGLLVEGGIHVTGDLRDLRILHSTLVPGRSVEQEAANPPNGPSLLVDGGPAGGRINTLLEVAIAFSIVGALRIPEHVTRLHLLDSLVDGIEKVGDDKGVAISEPFTAPASPTSGPPAHIERTTILGSSRFFDLEMASESIFSAIVLVERRQAGCVRFSYVPPGSETPQQYRCQPALEIAVETERRLRESATTGVPLPAGWEAVLEAQIETWLVPSFEAVDYGEPAYGQLRRTCPIQIRTGAADGSEMGAFCLLKQPQREANLRLRLDEYLPIGLEAGLIFVS